MMQQKNFLKGFGLFNAILMFGVSPVWAPKVRVVRSTKPHSAVVRTPKVSKPYKATARSPRPHIAKADGSVRPKGKEPVVIARGPAVLPPGHFWINKPYEWHAHKAWMPLYLPLMYPERFALGLAAVVLGGVFIKKGFS